MRQIHGRWLMALALWAGTGAVPVWAADQAAVQGTRVYGNRELPKVLYIVPWKKAELGDLVGRPVLSLLDEALAPVDREVFRRELNYHEIVQRELIHPAPVQPAAGQR